MRIRRLQYEVPVQSPPHFLGTTTFAIIVEPYLKRPRVLLVDDMPEILALCADVLRSTCDVVGTALDGMSVIAAVEKTAPDVLVLDISMSGLNGVEVARLLRSAGCRAAIVFLSGDLDFMTADMEFMTTALQAGGSGFVAKRLISSDLPVAIREALAGRVFVSASRPG
jgi:DNA-binding NarL/FixJ family response regulator